MKSCEGGYTKYFDKVDSKFANYTAKDFHAGGYRVVPPAAVREDRSSPRMWC